MNKRKHVFLYQYLDLIKYNDYIKYRVIRSFIRFYLDIFTTPNTLFIFGVQRSGTSVTFHTLSKFFGVKGYNEYSVLTQNGDEGLRFTSLDLIQKELDRNLEPYVVNKPLVESQNADLILSRIKYSKGIWMYRNYKDVVSSFHKKFGDDIGHHHLQLIIEGQDTNWRAERIPEYLKKVVIDFYKQNLSNNDATAMYWFVRNSLYFEYDFNLIKNLKLIKYEHLTSNTNFCISKICDLWDYTYEVDFSKLEFRSDSIKKGKGLELNPQIDNLCGGLLKKLDKEFKNQNYFFTL